jgi:hypothetical protein
MSLLDMIRRPAVHPAVPGEVYTTHTRPPVLHLPIRTQASHPTAACGWITTRDAVRTTNEVRWTGPVWCQDCWPGRRCQVCGAPSGQYQECSVCSRERMLAEIRMEQATDDAGWSR